MVVFGENINCNDGYVMQAKTIKSTNVKTDGSGCVDTSVPRKEYLYFTDMEMSSLTLKDDYVIVLNWLIAKSDDAWDSFFYLSGRNLAYHSEDSTKTDPSIDANLT